MWQDALITLCTEHDAYGEGSPYAGPKGRVEACAHELAHGFVLAEKPLSSEVVNLRHRNMRKLDSDKSEAMTIAVEFMFLQAMGFKVGLGTLVGYAIADNWKIKTRPALLREVQKKMKTKRAARLTTSANHGDRTMLAGRGRYIEAGQMTLVPRTAVHITGGPNEVDKLLSSNPALARAIVTNRPSAGEGD